MKSFPPLKAMAKGSQTNVETWTWRFQNKRLLSSLSLSLSLSLPPATACLLAWLLLPPHSLPASHFVVGMPARQAGEEAAARQAGGEDDGLRSSLLSSPLASRLLCTPPFAFASAVAVVLYWRKMRGWPGPLSSLSPPLKPSKQQTFGHRIGRDGRGEGKRRSTQQARGRRGRGRG